MSHPRRPIHSIVKGGLVRGQGVKYKVGQIFGGIRDTRLVTDIKIVDIVYDYKFFEKSSSERYHIYVEAVNVDIPEAFLWKSITGTDITPEYSIDKQIII